MLRSDFLSFSHLVSTSLSLLVSSSQPQSHIKSAFRLVYKTQKKGINNSPLPSANSNCLLPSAIRLQPNLYRTQKKGTKNSLLAISVSIPDQTISGLKHIAHILVICPFISQSLRLLVNQSLRLLTAYRRFPCSVIYSHTGTPATAKRKHHILPICFRFERSFLFRKAILVKQQPSWHW
jgi:hypothetical protein